MGGRSIRKSLLLGVTVAVGLVMVVGGVLVYLVMKRASFEQFDHALVEHAELVQASMVWDQGRVKFEGAAYTVLEGNEEFDLFQAWLGNGGGELAKSPVLGDQTLERPQAKAEKPTFVEIKAPWGAPMRAVEMTFIPATEHPEDGAVPDDVRIELIVAHDLGELTESLERLRYALAAVGAGIFIALLLAISHIIGRALRPLAALTEELRQRDEGRLDAPLEEVEGVPGELRPLVTTFNILLGRIRHSFERERQFTSSAAHELRTPLAGLISRLEHATRRSRAADDYRDAIERGLGTARELHGLVERLLSLARLGNASVTTEICEVPVNLLVDGALEVFAQDAARKQLRVVREIPDNALMRTDPALMQIVLNNLVENAVNYANERGGIGIAFVNGSSEDTWRISNTGSEVSAAQVEEVFEPFWRHDQGRTEAAVHAGLGLAITKKIVELLGGRIQVTSERGGDFVVTARFAKLE